MTKFIFEYYCTKLITTHYDKVDVFKDKIKLKVYHDVYGWRHDVSMTSDY